jgi:hypothetical protein
MVTWLDIDDNDAEGSVIDPITDSNAGRLSPRQAFRRKTQRG